MKKFIGGLLIACCLITPTLAGNQSRPHGETIEWLGRPMFKGVEDNKLTASDKWTMNVRIGLRSDGVVVWEYVK